MSYLAIIFDKDKILLGQFQNFTEAHAKNFILNFPEAEYFLFFNDAGPIEGEILLNEDSKKLNKGKHIQHKTEKKLRKFFHERYELESHYEDKDENTKKNIKANLKHIKDGGAEDTVPFPMEEEELIFIPDHIEVEESITPLLFLSAKELKSKGA